VSRVYIGSFWDKPINEAGKDNAELFDAEKQDLLSDLRGLPRNSAVRKVNELLKRARLAKVHALLISHLAQNMPYMWGHKAKQNKLVGRLDEEYRKVQKLHALAPGDFPSPDKLKKGVRRTRHAYFSESLSCLTFLIFSISWKRSRCQISLR